MAFDQEKKQAISEAREKEREKKAREAIRKNNTGRNKGKVKADIQKAKNINPVGALSVLSQFNIFMDWVYAAALVAAILKDILDFSEATGVGYIFVIITTFMCSIFIAMMMLLGDSMGGTKERNSTKSIRNWLILLAGTTTEFIFGLDMLPIETLTVIIIYFFVLAARKEMAEKRKSKQGESEMEAYGAA